MNMINKFLFVIFYLLSGNNIANAEQPDGSCWNDSPYQVVSGLTAYFKSAKAGSTAASGAGDGQLQYDATCNPVTGSTKPAQITYADLKWGRSLTPVDNHTAHFTDDLDITNMNMGSSYTYTSFSVPSTHVNQYAGPSSPSVQSVIQTWGFTSAGFTLVLRRDVIGGAVIVPAGIVIAEVYPTSTSSTASIPSLVVVTSSSVIPFPNTCSINNNVQINIPFGDVGMEQLKSDGPSSTIKLDQQLNYSCSSSLTQDIAITLAATPASFDSNGIQSSLPDVGVVMMHNGEVVPPNKSFSSKLVNGTGSDTVTFAPIIRSGATNVQGNFTASATLVMTSA